MKEYNKEQKKTVIILGMHRSGTSVIAKILSVLGVDMGDYLDTKSVFSNVSGHYEDKEFVELNECILRQQGFTWDKPPERAIINSNLKNEIQKITSKNKNLWGWKDPRTVFTINLFLPYIKNPYIIVCFRNNLHVAQSLKKRNNINIIEGINLSNKYNKEIFNFLDKYPKLPILFVSYEDIISSVKNETKKIVKFLNINYTRSLEKKVKKIILSKKKIKQLRKKIKNKINKKNWFDNFFNKKLIKIKIINRYLCLFNSFIFSTKTEGLLISVVRVIRYVFFNKGVYNKRNIDDYKKWIKNNENYNLEEIKKEIYNFKYKPKISIIIPVYNVEPKWIDKCIQSVINQYYDNWELCIYDDASTNKKTLNYLKQWENKNKKIKIFYGKINLHISEASNNALKLATGDFIALLDNDDELSLNALYEVVKLLNRHKEADFIYSDEDKIEENGKRVEPFFKPDWNKRLFLSMMYTCYLGVYRKKIVDKIGGFRKGYEGSQDYDLVLRFIEQISEKNIFHIPKILYHWRKIDSSNASNINAKLYVRENAKKALALYAKNKNILAIVKDGISPVSYNFERIIVKQKKIAIITVYRGNIRLFKQSIDNLFKKTIYNGFELIVGVEKRDFLKINKINNNIIFKIIDDSDDVLAKNYLIKDIKAEYILFWDYLIFDFNQFWLKKMAQEMEDKRVAMVGPKILFKNKYIYHAGIVVGKKNIKNYIFRFFPKNTFEYFSLAQTTRFVSAVTGNCVLIKKNVLDEIGFFNSKFGNYADIDFCLRVNDNNYRIVYTPYSVVHSFVRLKRKKQDKYIYALFKKKWLLLLKKDKYYNINLDKDSPYFKIKK